MHLSMRTLVGLLLSNILTGMLATIMCSLLNMSVAPNATLVLHFTAARMSSLIFLIHALSLGDRAEG